MGPLTPDTQMSPGAGMSAAPAARVPSHRIALQGFTFIKL